MSGQPDIRSAGPAALEENLVDREARNPYFRWLMHLGAPLAASLVIHLVLIVLIGLKTWPMLIRAAIDIGEYNASVADASPDLDKTFQWDAQDDLTTPEQPEKLENLDDLRNINEVDTKELENVAADMGANSDSLGIGEGALALWGTGSGGGGSGSGGFGGSGTGSGGARFGEANVWGAKLNANRIVYVVDFSGSIIVAVEDLKRELKRSIGQLKPFQSFDVVLFYSNQDKAVAETFSGSLQVANDETRKRFAAWLATKTPRGGSDALPAVKRALSMRPEAVFLFSDGLFDTSDTVEQIKQLNKSKTKFACLVFDEVLLNDSSGVPHETEGARNLRKIAEQSGGPFHIVTAKDLRR